MWFQFADEVLDEAVGDGGGDGGFFHVHAVDELEDVACDEVGIFTGHVVGILRAGVPLGGVGFTFRFVFQRLGGVDRGSNFFLLDW